MYKSHLDQGFEIVKENLIKKQSLEQIHLTLKSRGYSENDIYLCFQAGLILVKDREDHDLQYNVVQKKESSHQA